ncbi:hypothetical protein A9Z42_0016260 [Trichoderma parareesei]|uniref:Gamma-glutamylcyclotransferase AIG2-like domain-containing protein n=1 Tax=Trichoderma parareesei TaxID=858221 RepID=A0A2H2ZPP1_TRIPA|nr:hypothetical protein A9Z42_0016260 [Trichoderma parareesei]
MDLLAACEDLAANVAAFDTANDDDDDDDDDDSHIAESDQAMWTTLFGFSPDEAAMAIRNWRADFARPTISQAAWLLIKEAKMAEGFNKEAYEYELSRTRTAQKPQLQLSEAVEHDEAKYLVKLDECDSLASAESVDLMRFLPKEPNILHGTDDDGNMTRFCLVSSSQKMDFLNALSAAYPSFQPTLIRTSVASKDLSTACYPTLGIDTTLPQFRPDSSSSLAPAQPAQDEYPVWYFFYDTLADANVLSRVIGSAVNTATDISYKSARIQRGRLTLLGEKYLALVDADQESVVDSWAYQVKSQAEEDSLRVYETGKYEVVRCTMEFIGEDVSSVQGLTFRLARG